MPRRRDCSRRGSGRRLVRAANAHLRACPSSGRLRCPQLGGRVRLPQRRDHRGQHGNGRYRDDEGQPTPAGTRTSTGGTGSPAVAVSVMAGISRCARPIPSASPTSAAGPLIMISSRQNSLAWAPPGTPSAASRARCPRRAARARRHADAESERGEHRRGRSDGQRRLDGRRRLGSCSRAAGHGGRVDDARARRQAARRQPVGSAQPPRRRGQRRSASADERVLKIGLIGDDRAAGGDGRELRDGDEHVAAHGGAAMLIGTLAPLVRPFARRKALVAISGTRSRGGGMLNCTSAGKRGQPYWASVAGAAGPGRYRDPG